MTLTVFLAVLAAALMHAGWNVLVKLKLDRFLSLFLIQTLMGAIGLSMVLAFPLASSASWPYALSSGVLHLGYNVFLARSYRTGDLSQVYPIARGASPLLTLAVTWLAADEHVGTTGLAGIALLVGGIWFIGLAGRKAVKLDGITLFYALGTSAFIAAYTVNDGLGARVSGSPSSYAGLVFVLDAVMLFAYAVATRGIGVVREVLPYWANGMMGAVLSAGAYWIAIWAMARAPIAAVAALRETSILFVMLLSIKVLREQVTAARLYGAGLVVVGAILLRLS